MHLYEDPDLTGEDKERFLWGSEKKKVWVPEQTLTHS